MKNILFLLLVISSLIGCGSNKENNVSVTECETVTRSAAMVKMTALDKIELVDLNGKVLRLQGYLRMNFEDMGIYPDPKSNCKEGFWITIADGSKELYDKMLEYNGRKVELVGVLNLNEKGHENCFLAGVDKVSCVTLIK
jgi:uncharacterized lipoprotein NlpE involved in copper resistance